MRIAATILAPCLALVLGMTGNPAQAQSTDGFHAAMVFPVVVDTASFVQRFNFRNNNDVAVTIAPKFFPADGTTAVATACPTIFINPGAHRTLTSLRAICPGLPAGSQFGYLQLLSAGASGGSALTFAAYSRVSNAAGAGFSVEAFPLTTFTSAMSEVHGLRRLSATAGSPAYQTNCFFSDLAKVDTTTPDVPTTIHYALYDNVMTLRGSGDLPLVPGQFVRILDIFAAAGLVGDWNDMVLRVTSTSTELPGLMSFCTVQDNTSFGADFRIAKQFVGNSPLSATTNHGAQDIFATRDVWLSHDSLNRPFEIGPGVNSNTHVVFYHSNDFLACELINPATGLRALQSYGLEVRTVDPDETPGAGGNNATAIPDTGYLYTGDKNDGEQGANGRAIIEVEDNETNSAATRPYILHCKTGSGTTGFDMLRYKEPIGRF